MEASAHKMPQIRRKNQLYHAAHRTSYDASRLLMCQPGQAKTRLAPSPLCRDARFCLNNYGMWHPHTLPRNNVTLFIDRQLTPLFCWKQDSAGTRASIGSRRKSSVNLAMVRRCATSGTKSITLFGQRDSGLILRRGIAPAQLQIESST